MHYVCKPTKIAIYINTAYKTATQIQRELGCDVLINGGLFDGSFRPCCWLKVDGTILHGEEWSNFGYGWDSDKLVMDSSVNIAKYRNFIDCVALIRQGTPIDPLTYPIEMGGIRGRSAIGIRRDGNVVFYCTQDGSAYALTPEQLRTEMFNLGCMSAVMLDGGMSSRCITPNGTIPANSRRPYLHNYIAAWTGKVPEQQNPQTQNPQCPYSEPTRNVGWGSLGDGARWVQWQLSRKGFSCAVDGIFLWGSVGTLKQFQAAHGLVADGVCGPLTREQLRK